VAAPVNLGWGQKETQFQGKVIIGMVTTPLPSQSQRIHSMDVTCPTLPLRQGIKSGGRCLLSARLDAA